MEPTQAPIAKKLSKPKKGQAPNHNEIIIEEIRKTKKNEPKVFPQIVLVDKEAFPSDIWGQRTHILKDFWKSDCDRILVAKKADTGSIVGYASYIKLSGNKSCYVMRIAVRAKSQRQGIGRKMIAYLLEKFPDSIALDVNVENQKAIDFYTKIGLSLSEKYKVMDRTGFVTFETPYPNFKIKQRE